MLEHLDLNALQDENARERVARLLNLIEKLSADLRDAQAEIQRLRVEGYFLRPFRGVHKRNLGQYVAICEFSINTKKVTPQFISALVALH